MSVSEPANDPNGPEETSRVQTLSSVAPPPLHEEGVARAHDIPTYVPASVARQPLRMVGWVMVIGGAIALALVLIVPRLRSTSSPAPLAAPKPPALPAAPQQKAQMPEQPPAKVATTPAPAKSRRTKRASAAAAPADAVHAKETNIRIRARVAPVRAAPEADAKVVCSVKRGTVMRSLQQAEASKGRWFAVHCDKDSPGWVHENFVSARP